MARRTLIINVVKQRKNLTGRRNKKLSYPRNTLFVSVLTRSISTLNDSSNKGKILTKCQQPRSAKLAFKTSIVQQCMGARSYKIFSANLSYAGFKAFCLVEEGQMT